MNAKMDLELGYRSLPDAIADHIVNLIATGQLQPGQRLYEKDICSLLNVSRIPAREALRTLQTQGVVRSEPNRGTFITHFGSSETLELLEIRLCVERIAVRRLLARAASEPRLLDELLENIAAMKRAALLSDRLSYCRADLSFHERVVTLSDSPMLKPIWDSLSRGVLVFLMQERDDSYDFNKSVVDHEKLVALMRTGDLARIEAEWAHHIGVVIGNLEPGL